MIYLMLRGLTVFLYEEGRTRVRGVAALAVGAPT
jgi:hypothetical protein